MRIDDASDELLNCRDRFQTHYNGSGVLSGAREGDKDINLHSDNGDPRELWSNGTAMWVVDSRDDIIYAYLPVD